MLFLDLKRGRTSHQGDIMKQRCSLHGGHEGGGERRKGERKRGLWIKIFP
jgi:hypothetical protein